MQRNSIDYEKYIKDYGPEQIIIPIDKLSRINTNYRASIWTGEHMQATLMRINPNDDVGVEIHENLEQLLFITSGVAEVYYGKTEKQLSFEGYAEVGDMITVPAGTWHNIKNASQSPLKMYSVYAPVKHAYGTIQKTKSDAVGD